MPGAILDTSLNNLGLNERKAICLGQNPHHVT